MPSKLALCLGAAALACLAACAKEGPAEKAGKQIDAAMEEAREEMKEAGEEMAEAAKDMQADLKKEGQQIAEDVKDGAREACEETKEAVGAKDTDC